MIKIIRDIVGITDTAHATVPFTLENLPDKSLKIETIAVNGDTYTVKTNWIYQVLDDDEVLTSQITKEKHEDGLFVVRIDLSQINASSIYIRIYNDDTSFITPQIHIMKKSQGSVVTRSIELDFRPKRLKVIDSVECTANGALVPFDNSNFSIQVLASNNSTSKTPVWEDMTSEYLNKSEFIFVNNAKDNGKLWSVSVKYVVRKLSTNSTVEISDIKLVVL